MAYPLKNFALLLFCITVTSHVIPGPTSYVRTKDSVSANRLFKLQVETYKISLDDHSPTLDDGAIRWKQAASNNGVADEIGTEVAQDTVEKENEAIVMAKTPFTLSVDWSPSSGWINTTPDVRATTAITRYWLHKSSSPIYDWVLEFSCEETYKYTFHDYDDTYVVDINVNGDHLFRYNSKKPTILMINGE